MIRSLRDQRKQIIIGDDMNAKFPLENEGVGGEIITSLIKTNNMVAVNR